MSNSNSPAKITEVMQELSDKVRSRKGPVISAHNGVEALAQPPCLPPTPATLHVTPLKEDAAERFGEVQRRAEEKTEVSRYIPKFLRRLFREQGGFNKEVLEVGKFLMKENREANKRLREIIAYLQAENGWFDGVMAAFAQVQRTLQRRSENQYSLEARLLAMDNKVAEARSESVRKQQQLEESLRALASVLNDEKNARHDTDTRLAASNHALSAELKARESIEERLEAMRAALAGEAKAREAVEERVNRQHGRLHGISDIPEIDQHQFDSFYLAFENQFRGTRADIKQRVRVYVPFIKKARVGKRTSPVLDLGCGRGEWLELLRDEGLVGRGIDLNEFMVSECVERKLVVVQADVIEHLGTLRSDSQGAITAFHLIEHLPFPILVKLFAESLRVLRRGGICIFETPNPDNLQVGSNRFYSDPTHLRPLPHTLTEFVMSTAGFKRVEVLPLHPDDNAVPMTDDAAPVERFAHQLFFGAQDYAVIGRK